MKKTLLIPLLAGSALVVGAIAYAEGMPMHHMMGKEDMQRHHAEMCSDMLAEETGHMAFLETKLALTPAEQGAFNRWKDLKLSEAKEHSGKCASMRMPQMGARPSPLEHLTYEEDMLKNRLADIQAERPVLAALYNSLSDQQKLAFAEEGHHMHGHGMHRMPRMMGHGPHDGYDEDGPMHDDPPPQGE
jgi:hypothetical protein